MSAARWVTDLEVSNDILRRERYGVIEMVDGRLRGVQLRRWPKRVYPWEVLGWGERQHRRRAGNRCLCFYNQPRGHEQFLVLKYVFSARQTTLATFHGALLILDEIARLKQSDALLCDAANFRISRRLLARGGWEPHCPSRWHRHYIKRFYGQYPDGVAARRLWQADDTLAGGCPGIATGGPSLWDQAENLGELANAVVGVK